MGYFVAIDGGTTNTRLFLVRGKQVVGTVKKNVGAGKNIGGTGALAEAVRGGMSELALSAGISVSDIEKTVASGMITSGIGLYEVEHIPAPAGVGELRAAVCRTILPEISSAPFFFVPGVKMCSSDLESADMMRGEETELVGLMQFSELGSFSDSLVVLPGSHSKLVRTDGAGRICRFSTMLTGEMIAALAGGTILRDSVCLSQGEASEESLLLGYRICREMGINRALFKVRTYKNLLHATEREVYGFFLGAVLCGEIDAILREDAKRIIISGNKYIKNAMTVMLRALSDREIVCVPDEITEKSTVSGLIALCSADFA
ncbi:MAG: 2-dehydro-3-deoxygalactonokinase [Eubacteriales bacterium]